MKLKVVLIALAVAIAFISLYGLIVSRIADGEVHPEANRQRLADVLLREYHVTKYTVGSSYWYTNRDWSDSLYFTHENVDYEIRGYFWGNGNDEWSYKVIRI